MADSVDAEQHTPARCHTTYLPAHTIPSSVADLSMWPPTDRWNISRWSVHGCANADMDSIFTNMKNSSNCSSPRSTACTLTIRQTRAPHDPEWDYFISKVTKGLNEGWLEGVTFEDLRARAGGTFRAGYGRAQAEYLDASGAVVRKDLL